MEQEQKLGGRVFRYYFYKKILLGIVLLVISVIALSFKDTLVSVTTPIFSANAANNIINYLVIGLFSISFIALLGGVFISWLDYISCTFILGDLSFVIKRGILSKKITTIPYKQIQDISIEQSFSNRMMGVCKLVILTAGNDNNDKEDESEGIFKVIDIDVAKNLQNTILQKNNIQKS
jgi:uncharacterized membrane protein YdbT with pleckstrin-like domain